MLASFAGVRKSFGDTVALEELTFGELVNIDQVIETLQLMKNPEERERRRGKLQ